MQTVNARRIKVEKSLKLLTTVRVSGHHVRGGDGIIVTGDVMACKVDGHDDGMIAEEVNSDTFNFIPPVVQVCFTSTGTSIGG